MKIFEYLAAACPVVATAIDACSRFASPALLRPPTADALRPQPSRSPAGVKGGPSRALAVAAPHLPGPPKRASRI